MMIVILFILGSVVVALAVLLYPAPPGRTRPRLLRTSWALWCLQPALLFGGLLVALAIREALGYTSSNVPADVDAWLTLIILAPVGLGLLAGTIAGGLAWRAERVELPSTSRRRWALAALLANTVWFVAGAWLMVAPAVAIGLDVVGVALALAMLLWPSRRTEIGVPTETDLTDVGSAPPVHDEHLIG